MTILTTVVSSLVLFLIGLALGALYMYWVYEKKKRFVEWMEDSIFNLHRESFANLYDEYEADLKALQQEFKNSLMQTQAEHEQNLYNSETPDNLGDEEISEEEEAFFKKKTKTGLH
jgi:hypothetical protein